MKDIYKVFEFDLITKQIEPYCRTEIGLNKIRSLVMFDNEDDLKDELSHLKEMMGYIVKYRNLKITPHKDLTNMFSLIEKGGCGNIDFFYQVSLYLENAKDIRNESSKDDSFPFIMELIRKLEECDSLRNEIERIITKDLQIADNASPLLRDIRKSLHQEESGQQKIINQLLLKYKDYLNNERVALRNGAFALPIKAHYKSRVDGIVIDESDTGLTLFIEPSEIIASNNKIMRLKEKEKEEINRIIDELTLHVLNHLEEIRIDQEILCYMDFLLSKANYALDEDDIVGELVDERIISLKGARHPLIDKKKVVRNSYILDKQKIMLITGPNAGGKTVSIKLIGLCIIMHQCALALPTIEEAKLCFFENLYVDMGDNQSLLDNLSTFSGHISSLKEIVKGTNNRSMVILDEIGTGTSPLEGEALAIGFIEYLHKKDSFGVLTSHFDGLKNYALENDYILNASMAFSEERIEPTYHLRLGVAGKSYGLEMASRLGLSNDILNTANQYIESKKETDKEITLSLLQHKLEENESLTLELEEKMNETNKKLLEIEKEKKNLLALQEEIRMNAEEEKEKIIEETKGKIDAIYEEFKKSESYKLHEIITAKRNLDLLHSEEEEEEEESISLKINDYVSVSSFGARGKVIRLNGDKVTILTDTGMNLNCKTNQCKKVEKVKKTTNKTYVSSYKVDKKVPLECNVIGYFVNDALPVIDKYLDDALTARYSEVRIIHGAGTGKLRSAVHDYLRGRKDIVSFRLGGLGEGSVGATVVTLKK